MNSSTDTTAQTGIFYKNFDDYVNGKSSQISLINEWNEPIFGIVPPIDLAGMHVDFFQLNYGDDELAKEMFSEGEACMEVATYCYNCQEYFPYHGLCKCELE